MPYPKSPFPDTFNPDVITKYLATNELEKLLSWLCTAPKLTSFRVNSLQTDRISVIKALQDHLNKVLGCNVVTAEFSPVSPEVIVIGPLNETQFERHPQEVIVDVDCAAAVLRGAHIYAPGILGMLPTAQSGDLVSVYADMNKRCKKGYAKLFDSSQTQFIGNGRIKMTRRELFGENLRPAGVAVEMLQVTSRCPCIGDNFLPPGWAMLQNLPSILCVEALGVDKSDIVLDMCAAPGNKTTHIAALMENQGTLIALDKTPNKIRQLNANCDKFGAKVFIYQANSCNILTDIGRDVTLGPPFCPSSFDKILLDAPCSALGKRPQLANSSSEKKVLSHCPVQKKLFRAAVALLKPGGTLVYSTCTITLAENEGIVAWALRSFNCLTLVKPKNSLGGLGWDGAGLSDEDRAKVQRFGPDVSFDSIGFFYACFTKI